jgi:CheY-like chemotaxis protein
MMPGMNGWELIARLRRDAALSRIPVCTMSAVEVGPSVEVQHSLRKPFELRELLSVVARFAGSYGARSP